MTVKRILKKTVKFFFWFTACLILLLTALLFLLQIPPVQNYLAQKTTSWLSQKTNTHVSLERIGISFPKSVSLKNFLVLDQAKDTLLFAGDFDINIRMFSLLDNQLNISGFSLSTATAKLKRKENDSTFNFNFLLEAFKGNPKPADTTNKNPLQINIDHITLEEIRFILDDGYGGLNLSTHLEKFESHMKETNIQNLEFSFTDLDIRGFTGTLRQHKKTEIKSDPAPTPTVQLLAENLTVSNSNFYIINDAEKEASSFRIGDLIIRDSKLNLAHQQIEINELNLNESFAYLTMHSAKDTIAENLPTSENKKKEDNWKISLKTLALKNNSFKYRDTKHEFQEDSSFSSSDINISHLSAKANELLLKPELVQAKINALSLNSDQRFHLKNLRAFVKLTKHSFETGELIMESNASAISANAKFSFESIESLKKHPQNLTIALDLNRAKIHHPEVLYFLPKFKKIPALSNSTSTNLKLNLKGKLNELYVTKAQISTGSSTKLNTKFFVKGLPDIQKIELEMPFMSLQSSRSDITLMGGNHLPGDISFPDSLAIDASFKGTLHDFSTKLKLESTSGAIEVKGALTNSNEYNVSAKMENINIAAIFKNKNLPETLDGVLEVNGKGFDTSTIKSEVIAKINRIRINKYTYRNLNARLSVDRKSVNGVVSLKDEFAEFNLTGLADFNAGNKHLDAELDLKGADLRRLNLTQKDLRVAFKAVADIRGQDVNNISGNAGITGIIISKGGKKYILDSLLFAAINEKNNSSLKVQSAIVGVNYKGTFAPAKLIEELKQTLNNYLPIDTSAKVIRTPQNFELSIELNNHPVISEVFLPELKSFEPGKIVASYNGEEKKLNANIEIKQFYYRDYQINNFKATVNSNPTDLNYKITAKAMSNSDLHFNNFLTEGSVSDNKLTTHISADDEKENQKINLRMLSELRHENAKLSLLQFALLGKEWSLSKDNFILIEKKGINVNDLAMTREESAIRVYSTTGEINSDINFDIKNIKLEDFSSIIQKDTLLIGGLMNGKLQLKRSNKSWGIVSDFTIQKLNFREIPLGDLYLEADNDGTNQFDVKMKLIGNGNDLMAEGMFLTTETGNTLDINLNFRPLTMKTVEAFSFGQIQQTEGDVKGQLKINGSVKQPSINGELTFSEAKANPLFLNSLLYLQNETVTIDKSGFHFKSFTVLDKNNNPAYINGSVLTKNMRDFNLNLNVQTNDFLILNTTKKKGQDYYGTLVIDSRIRVRGTPSYPIITSTVKLKDKSYFTFAVPESKLTTDKGEGVVLFIDSTKFNPILTRNESIEKQKSAVKNFDISSTIEIDKRAILKLMLDPSSEDSLVVRGSAALSFVLDPSGKISLTGLYTVEDGTYMVSLENLLKRKFRITPGSTIAWNGDPLDAIINLNAYYFLRTSPVDLVADQLEPSERNKFRQRFPFHVNLNLKGALLTPDLSFDISLPESDRGAMNGMLHARLEQLKENQSALNKQVFALLVLGRFIQENPLETEGSSGATTAARTTVGNFLSAQLNKFTSKMVPGVDINFDVQSYDDYSTGNAQGRTEVGIGVSKQLFNDRVSVQVGGSVDVEGERARQSNASDIAGDVTVEYKLTKDGRYRLKGFRLNQYTGALEGQIIQTGAGLLYTRDFESWLQLIRKETKERNNTDSLNVETNLYKK